MFHQDRLRWKSTQEAVGEVIPIQIGTIPMLCMYEGRPWDFINAGRWRLTEGMTGFHFQLEVPWSKMIYFQGKDGKRHVLSPVFPSEC